MTLDQKNILDLYKVAVDEVHKYHALHQHRVAFFAGLVSSLMAGTVAGLLNAKSSVHCLLVALGPIAMFAVCMVALRSINGIYRLLMETVTTRAKLEQVIGLSEPPSETILPKGPRYWETEAFVPARHLEDRIMFGKSSTEWQNNFMKQGFKRWTNAFFVGGIVIGFILFFAAIYSAMKF